MHIGRTKAKDTTALLLLDANGTFAVGAKEMLAGMAASRAPRHRGQRHRSRAG